VVVSGVEWGICGSVRLCYLGCPVIWQDGNAGVKWLKYAGMSLSDGTPFVALDLRQIV